MKKLAAGAAAALAVVTGVVLVAANRSTGGEPGQSGEKPFLEYSAATNNIEPEGEPITVTPAVLRHGEWVYRGLCIGCHGIEGDGNGAVWALGDEYAPEHKLPRKPRDFTQAVFKIRSTPSGSFPTDVDLFKSISRGLVADQDMPAFKFLPERDRWAVIAYIKTLSPLWEEEADYQDPPIEIGEPPVPDAGLIAAGRQVYERMQCAECHGPTGKGDGPSAPDLTDDSGLAILPRDFSDPAQFVGASDPKGVFQTFNTGLDGTPMPSFRDFLDDEQSWQLVWFVMSLRDGFDLESTRREMLQARGEYVPPVHVAAAPDAGVRTQAPAPVDDGGEQAQAGEAGPDVAESEGEAVQADSTGYREIEVSDGGTITGIVTYNGPIKTRTVLPTKDRGVCGGTRKEPLVVVGDGGAVTDSVVYIRAIEEGKPWPEMMLTTPVLDQEKCQFIPHVQVARQGDIDIVNSDPVLHNTHGYYGERTVFNVALPEQGQRVTRSLRRPGTVRVDCDAHGWMLGWVQVVDNPYFHQTGEDGRFQIDGIPPGDYTVVVWQESLGEREFAVTVGSGETVTLDVELEN